LSVRWGVDASQFYPPMMVSITFHKLFGCKKIGV